jgi:regulator of extracellular matrix RemA (YlzA/DUF370 family)
MVTELVHIGFGNILAMNRVIAIASPNSAPTKRSIQEGMNKGLVIYMTSGTRRCQDAQGRLVILFSSAWDLEYSQKENPDIAFAEMG